MSKLLRLFFIVILTIMSFFSAGQNNEPSYQSNPSLSFNAFLSGVKYAYIVMDEKNYQLISSEPNGGNAKAFAGVTDYLKDIGFEKVGWGVAKNAPQNLPSFCELALVSPSWTFANGTYNNIVVKFVSCKGDVFKFSITKTIMYNEFTDVQELFRKRLLEVYNNSNKLYNQSNALILASEMTDWTEEGLKKRFKEKGVDPFEGIYESAVGTTQMPKYKLGLVKTEAGYTLIYFSGAVNYLDWRESEVKATLSPTATPTLFKAEWKMGIKTVNKNTYVSFETGLMNVLMQDKDKTTYIKLYPTSSDNITPINGGPASGSGFALSPDGYVVTNHHVTNGASSIKVRGINGDFTKSYSAKLVIDDKNNDLSIIKIDDQKFSSLGVIPYIIPGKSCEVGCSIFCLGYPLRATMGEEVKLTNGIISSKSGFQGDITTYQISAPVQPGNSGGPLFDDKGNLIGIINSKHLGAENVSYAIKASYLLNLIDGLANAPKLSAISLLSGKTLPEQVKLVKKFIYIIEVN